MDYVVLTPAELILWREKAAPTIHKVTDLLLRGGAIGYLDLERALYKGSEEDSNISKDKRRVNPAAFKSIVQNCGILLTPEEYKNLRTAYSDEGGILVDEFLENVSPLKNLGKEELNILQNMFSDTDGRSKNNTSSSSMIELDVLLQTLREALLSEIPSKTEQQQQEEEEESAAEADVDAILASALAELEVVFTSERYPTHFIPARDVLHFFAALLRHHPALLPHVSLSVQRKEAPPSPSPSSSVLKAATPPPPPRGYEYYTDRDNRDEWRRGREEAPPRPMYGRHLPGYQGHLPTFRSKFGRSFHPIEESVPELTQPKTQKQMKHQDEKEETVMVPADRYGPGVELKENRMNKHHFKLA